MENTSRRSVAELLADDEIMQVVFTRTAASNKGLWALNRRERAGATLGWELFDLSVNRDHQYALMSADKAARVAAKHLNGLVPNAFTRADFRAQ